MLPRHRFSRPGASREYFDKIADAMGDEHDGDEARTYARGAAPLRFFRRKAATPSRESIPQHPDASAQR